MNYTRLTFNNADVSFSGATVYTRPAPNNVNPIFFNTTIYTPYNRGVNSWVLNTVPVNQGVIILGSGSGQIVEIEQTVGLLGSGQLIAIEQSVRLLQEGAGQLITIEQNTIATGVGKLVAISQRVHVAADNSFLARNGYDVNITIGGYQIPRNQIHGDIQTIKSVGDSSACVFTLIPPLGVQDYENYQGKPVYIDVIKNGSTTRIFNGFIDLPSLDLIEQTVSFNCTDRRATRINNLPHNVISNIGRYSEDVFGKIKDQDDELQKRLQTVTEDFTFDNNGGWRLTSWTPKASADFVLSNSGIYYNKPEVQYTNRSSTINTINFNLKYSYQRLHQQVVNINWPGYENFCRDYANVGYPSFPTKDMIRGAATQGGWRAISPISFVDIWPAGGFRCVGGDISWQPNDVKHEYEARHNMGIIRDDDGEPLLGPDGRPALLKVYILDINGKKIYDIVRTIITDTSSNLCRGASWKAATKFAQNVTEEYRITMKAPQAVNRYGTIPTEESVSILDEFDTSIWEDAESDYYAVDYNFYQNQKDNYSKLFDSFNVLLRKSKATILDSHRDVLVKFRRNIWPEIDLHHTVETTATKVSCRGRVNQIVHNINVDTGEDSTSVELRLSRMAGNGLDDQWAVIIPPIEDSQYIGSPKNIRLGTHIGLDPDPEVTPNADKWNGFIGNKNISGTQFALGYRTEFPESFIIDYPEIPDLIRDDRIVDSDYTFNIAIPNDPLTITYEDE